MLRELRIKDFAIIDELAVSFERGLNVLTGETGAGKSIIVDALGLALGEKAYAEMVKTGKESAVVEAYFEGEKSPALDDLGIPQEEGIILRRVLFSSGKSRAYINDNMVNVQTLHSAGGNLVDIHGQHEHQSLLDPRNQLRILDNAAGLAPEKERFAALFEEVRAMRERLKALKDAQRERAQGQDLLSFQAREIEASGLSPGEEESLLEERKILSNLTRLREFMEQAYTLLYGGEGSASETLSKAKAALEDIAAIDHEASEPLSLLSSAMPLVEEAAMFVRAGRERYEMDPERLGRVEERIELIRKLKKKYGETIEEILGYGERAQEELDALSHFEESAAELEQALIEKERGLLEKAMALSEKRKKAAREAELSVGATLKSLAMPNAVFGIEIRETEPGPEGVDRAEFVFTANPGEALKPLSKTASGGELSRLMLAIKGAMKEREIPVLVFDEVDAGIGGRTAANVASRLREISRTHQVLCITHLPQIASAADAHFSVLKKEKKDGVKVILKKVDGAEREEEIARMLGGKLTGVSLKHAKELIQGSLNL